MEREKHSAHVCMHRVQAKHRTAHACMHASCVGKAPYSLCVHASCAGKAPYSSCMHASCASKAPYSSCIVCRQSSVQLMYARIVCSHNTVQLMYACVVCRQSTVQLPKQYDINWISRSYYCNKHFFVCVITGIDRRGNDMYVASSAQIGSFQGFNRWHTAVSFSHSVRSWLGHSPLTK
jgi:hypothetical protein